MKKLATAKLYEEDTLVQEVEGDLVLVLTIREKETTVERSACLYGTNNLETLVTMLKYVTGQTQPILDKIKEEFGEDAAKQAMRHIIDSKIAELVEGLQR